MKIGPNQEKWLKALEGGDYKQGFTNLSSDKEEYCCLGVGCEVFSITKEKQTFNSTYIFVYGKEKTAHLAPEELQDLLALLDFSGVFKNPLVFENANYFSLIGANDSGVPFSVIAKFCRENPEAVFSESR